MVLIQETYRQGDGGVACSNHARAFGFDLLLTGVCKIMEQESAVDLTIENNFTYHAPKPGQPERYAIIRQRAKEFAYLISQECPPSRERSLAMTHLEESVFCANAGIARNE